MTGWGAIACQGYSVGLGRPALVCESFGTSVGQLPTVEREFTLLRKEWGICHRVQGKYYSISRSPP